MLESAVTIRNRGWVRSARPARAARTVAAVPWMVRKSASSFMFATAARTVASMSSILRSRKIRLPRSFSSRTSGNPAPMKSCHPTL